MIANYRVISPYSLISSAFQPTCILYDQDRKWKWMFFVCITTYYELKSMSNWVGFFGHVLTTTWFLGRLALKLSYVQSISWTILSFPHDPIYQIRTRTLIKYRIYTFLYILKHAYCPPNVPFYLHRCVVVSLTSNRHLLQSYACLLSKF